jgi:hypothetical protein
MRRLSSKIAHSNFSPTSVLIKSHVSEAESVQTILCKKFLTSGSNENILM